MIHTRDDVGRPKADRASMNREAIHRGGPKGADRRTSGATKSHEYPTGGVV